MSLVPFTFNKVELQVATIRAKEVCKALVYKKDTAKTTNIIRAHCSTENITQKYQLTGVHAAATPINWPSDSQKYYLYIKEEGLYELVFSSQQPLAKAFRKHCCNVMLPHIQQQLISKMKEAIEEKDTRIQAIW